MTKEEQTKEVVKELTSFLNTYSVDEKIELFNNQMSREHRTLQQTFTKLCIGWLEHIATDEYHTDGRNESSKEFGKLFVQLFQEYSEKEQPIGTKFYISKGYKLHKHIPLI